MSDEREMLDYLEIDRVEELFSDVPSEVREGLDLPKGKNEMEVLKEVKGKLSKNETLGDYTSFLGAGLYRHFIPSAVQEIIGRSEFYTSYTPYQSEISQGMLQSLFEYQSLVCELTGMEAANTSMYDYSTAFAEAVLMAKRVGKGNKVLIPKNIHWDRVPVLENYLKGKDFELEFVGYDKETGQIDVDELKKKADDDDLLAIYVESPNVFGVLESDVGAFRDIKEEKDAVLICGTNPLALTLMKPPSEWGADIVVGDSQSVGIPPSFGGPTVGIFACKEKYIRRMPGRVIGETEDAEGRRAYCMTLQTREQHIRRERATSNICTNQSLMALSSAVHMFAKGGKGLENVARENYKRAHELSEKLDEIEGVQSPLFSGPFFSEFTVGLSKDSEEVVKRCFEEEVLPGVRLDSEEPERFPKLSSSLLVSVTEMNGEEDIDELVETLKGVVS